MLGNVTEWCADDWIGHYATGPNTEKPRHLTGTRNPVLKVRRGGDWSSDAGECRSASRDFRTRKYQQPVAGVRIAMNHITRNRAAKWGHHQ